MRSRKPLQRKECKDRKVTAGSQNDTAFKPGQGFCLSSRLRAETLWRASAYSASMSDRRERAVQAFRTGLFALFGLRSSRIQLIALACLFILAAPGCAAQLGEVKGVSRAGHAIQVGAFASVQNAQRLSSRLQAKGIDAYYFRKENGVYAVRFGDYPSRDAARQAAGKLAAEKVIGEYFIASPDNGYQAKAKQPAVRGGGEATTPTKAAPELGPVAARTAERFVGLPYQWGGNNVVEGMDCSGFVRAVYNLCGVNIPRSSQEQFRVGENVERGELREGDLVFFGPSQESINHVGIYVGNGRFVHAPRRGEEIRVTALDDAYFSRCFVGAKRYF